jgi:hypothetical protein
VKFGEQVTKRPGEFGPWLNWVLTVSIKQEYPEGNRAMLEAASEINEAGKSGQLPTRIAYFPFDPDWRAWIPDVLPRFLEGIRVATAIRRAVPQEPVNDVALAELFDKAANRWPSLVFPRQQGSTMIGQDPNHDIHRLRFLESRAEKITIVLDLFIFAFVLAGTLGGRLLMRQELLISCLLLALIFVAGRAGLYAILDANVGWNEVRYMTLLSPLSAVWILFAAAFLGSVGDRRHRLPRDLNA